ncbi:MAG: hypothetical protein HYT83_00645 [Candidatus Levybacteria bacterium]|nr:hypothetical protein [Candidatus Levybacteria bacterium]
MSKRKKTRQQKIIADLRRKLQSTSHPSSTSQAIDNKSIVQNTLPNQEKQTNTNKFISTYITNKVVSAGVYSYLPYDLQKTFFLTTSIVAVELLLFFLLRNHVIVLPNLNF